MNAINDFIEAEDRVADAQRDLNQAKEALIEKLVRDQRFDMFTLDLKKVYREAGVPPKNRR